MTATQLPTLQVRKVRGDREGNLVPLTFINILVNNVLRRLPHVATTALLTIEVQEVRGREGEVSNQSEAE